MRNFDFNKYSLALKQRLRDILAKHKTAYAFKASEIYLQTLETTLDALQTQEERFADFVIQKQKEIDLMESSLIKNKLQENLDKIAKDTYKHFNEIADKYKWILKSNRDDNDDNLLILEK